jgi:GntR family transcriptional regulator
MEFRDNEAIYLQIAAYVSEHIILNKWPVGEKIPSVRELAVELQVNPNTVVRAYEFLQQQDVIANKRGIGFFATSEAVFNIKKFRRERFLKQELPEFFKNIYLLDIKLNEVEKLYERFKSDHFNTPKNEDQ